MGQSAPGGQARPGREGAHGTRFLDRFAAWWRRQRRRSGRAVVGAAIAGHGPTRDEPTRNRRLRAAGRGRQTRAGDGRRARLGRCRLCRTCLSGSRDPRIRGPRIRGGRIRAGPDADATGRCRTDRTGVSHARAGSAAGRRRALGWGGGSAGGFGIRARRRSCAADARAAGRAGRSEEHTSELQSHS